VVSTSQATPIFCLTILTMPITTKTSPTYFILAMLIVVLAAAGLRYGSAILTLSDVRDEALMKQPIDDILNQGWSVDTAINYQEVKGPVFFWSYAAGGTILGGSMNDLRLISVLFFIASAAMFLLILYQCGARGMMLPAGAGLYVLLPYNAIVGQLLMSEPSFIFISLLLMWIVLWGLGASREQAKPILGPVLFGIVLSILLHHRPHAAAFAGAAVLVAFERDGLQSWRWWLAALFAGLSRLPLWYLWGGLVTSDYQGTFALGIRLECQTYLLAALLPITGVLIWPVLVDRAYRSWRWVVAVGGGVGLLLSIIAHPDMHGMVPHPYQGAQQEYAGIIKTALNLALPVGTWQQVALAVLATIGGASLGAMLAVAWNRAMLSTEGMVRRLTFWTLTGGLGLFSLTNSPVYDRYLVVWMLLMPIVWLFVLPRWLLLVQSLVMVMMLAYLVNNWA
jgi:hypothetical protein